MLAWGGVGRQFPRNLNCSNKNNRFIQIDCTYNMIIKLKSFETYLAKIRGAFGQAVAGPVGLHATV